MGLGVIEVTGQWECVSILSGVLWSDFYDCVTAVASHLLDL